MICSHARRSYSGGGGSLGVTTHGECSNVELGALRTVIYADNPVFLTWNYSYLMYLIWDMGFWMIEGRW